MPHAACIPAFPGAEGCCCRVLMWGGLGSRLHAHLCIAATHMCWFCLGLFNCLFIYSHVLVRAGENSIMIVGGANKAEWDFSPEAREASPAQGGRSRKQEPGRELLVVQAWCSSRRQTNETLAAPCEVQQQGMLPVQVRNVSMLAAACLVPAHMQSSHCAVMPCCPDLICNPCAAPAGMP